MYKESGIIDNFEEVQWGGIEGGQPEWSGVVLGAAAAPGPLLNWAVNLLSIARPHLANAAAVQHF